MEISDIIIQKWGLGGIAAFYIADKIVHWIWGSTTKWIASVDANTKAVEKLSAKVDLLDTTVKKYNGDMRIAFYNIREIREKTGMGQLSKPVDQ